jgi:hypothetical protein
VASFDDDLFVDLDRLEDELEAEAYGGLVDEDYDEWEWDRENEPFKKN